MPDHAVPGLAVRAPAHDLPALFDGRPLVIVESRLPDIVALHGAGARICRAHLSPEGVTLRLGAGGGTPEAAPVALDHAPPGVLALVAQTPLGLGRLAEWWRERGQEPPVQITAETGLAALPGLLAAALAAADAAMRRVCALEERAAALRIEAEEQRAAIAAMHQAVAGRPPPGLETRLDLAPDPALPPLRLAAGAAPLVVEPGIPTPGIARLSLHLAAAGGAALSVRLIGAESGRVLCAWLVPPPALPAGWLHLETPEPFPGRPESLLVGLRAEGEAGEVALSAAAEATREPALSIAVLPPGARLVRPLHMDWARWHGDSAASVPRLAAAQMLAEARTTGPGELDEGSAEARRLTLPDSEEVTRVTFGPMPEGCAALRCDLRLEAGAAEARLLLAGGAVATPWRVLPRQEARPFVLPLPAGAPAVAVELRAAGTAALRLFRPVLFPAAPPPEAASEAVAEPPAPARQVVAPRLGDLEGPYPRETWAAMPEPERPARADDADGPDYAEVVLDARQQGTGWELLDLRLRGLVFRGERWRELKFKFGLSGPNVVMEFRRAPSWPRAFETWPGTEKDAYGDKFVLVLEGEELRGLERVTPGRDVALVEALAAIMPRLVTEVLDEADADPCAAAATRLANHRRAEG